jgi:hypothetical protein
MRKHYFTIILTLLIGLGAYAHQAVAITCPSHNDCSSTDSTGHTAGTHRDTCLCPPWSAQLSDHCGRPDIMSRRLQQAFVRPDSKPSLLSALGFYPALRNQIPILNRTGPARCLHKTDSPLSYPIYLRTLALLC